MRNNVLYKTFNDDDDKVAIEREEVDVVDEK